MEIEALEMMMGYILQSRGRGRNGMNTATNIEAEVSRGRQEMEIWSSTGAIYQIILFVLSQITYMWRMAAVAAAASGTT